MDEIRAKLAEHRKRRLNTPKDCSTRIAQPHTRQSVFSPSSFNKIVFLTWTCLLSASFFCGLLLPFMITSTLCLLYFKGTSKDSENERGRLSAYSVFNPGCQEIQGTVNASKLQQEMMMVPS